MKFLGLLLVLSGQFTNILASPDHSQTTMKLEKVSEHTLVIKVKGMVCAFCAQGIESNFKKQDAVKKTIVDLDNMEVTLKLKSGKSLDEKVIKKVITDAGFSFVGMKEKQQI